MINLKNILVPIDFSEGSRVALNHAADLASDYGTKIHLLTIVEEESLSTNIGGDPLNTIDKWKNENLKKLDEFIPGKYKDLDIIKRVDGGLSYKIILDYAKENDIDLIIIGSNGKQGFIESWLGGTSYEVTRKANCPVLTVRPDCRGFVA